MQKITYSINKLYILMSEGLQEVKSVPHIWTLQGYLNVMYVLDFVIYVPAWFVNNIAGRRLQCYFAA